MTRFLRAIRVAIAAFVASWCGSAAAPALGPYRKAAERETCPNCERIIKEFSRRAGVPTTEELDAWTEAQRDLTPADMRAAEARRQNVIVEPPHPPRSIRE